MRIVHQPKLFEQFIDENHIRDILNVEALKGMELCQYDAGEIVLEAQEELSFYYFFISGKLKVFQRQMTGRNLLIQFYTQFDSLGDVELTQALPVTCTVEAIEKSYLFRIEASMLRKYTENDPRFLKHVIRSLSNKLRIADENHAFNLLNPVKNRLASYILWHKGSSESIAFDESLQDISEFIGTTYRQLHRAFMQLEEEGVLRRRGKKIEIMDAPQLEVLAGQIYHIL